VLPFRGSDWINARVEVVMAETTGGDKDRKRQLKLLFYIAAMMAFRRTTNHKFKKEELSTKLQNVPGSVVDSLLARFTECPRGSTECVLPLLHTHVLKLNPDRERLHSSSCVFSHICSRSVFASITTRPITRSSRAT
jgi:hypothetical protein